MTACGSCRSVALIPACTTCAAASTSRSRENCRVICVCPSVEFDVMFSVLIPPGKSALDLEQDLFLLWPGEVVSASTGLSGITLPADVAAQISVVREGRLRLEAKRSYESTQRGEVLEGGAPFITVVRTRVKLCRADSGTPPAIAPVAAMGSM